jgi:hypothetical protein
MSDDVTDSIRALKADIPVARENLTAAEMQMIIDAVGPKTVANIIKAKKDFKIARIPFLFSSIDTQAVVDILANDFSSVLK